MPQFEVEMHGKSYEVDAPSIEAFAQAYHGTGGDPFAGFTDQGPNAPAQAGASIGGDPFAGFSDQGPGSASAPQGDFLHPVKPKPAEGYLDRAKTVGERLLQYPRIALGQLHDAIDTLNRVKDGELDAASPEAAGAAFTVASTYAIPSPATGTGRQIARMAEPGYTATPGVSSGLHAAQTAADLGSPLPAGIVSDTPGMQAFTQGFRQVPFVGPSITEKVGQTVKAAGRRVGDISEELSGGPVSDRATVGATTRQSLQDVIEGNNSKIDAAYDDLRSNHIDPDALASLPRTEQALKGILRERGVAGMKNPEAGLGDVANLVDQGTSFNGLQRARSDIGAQLKALTPNPGFHAGDSKRLYAAMSADLEGIARYHALSDPDEAAAALKSANSTAQQFINRNTAIHKLLNNKSDEGMLGSIINAAKDKTGNLRQLAELRGQMPKEDFEKISGIALHELGHTDQGFSLNRFGTAWSKLSNSAKNVLIADPGHRKALDDIAGLGSFLKDADKYRNTSNTGHSAGILGGLVTAFEAAKDPTHIPAILGTLAGGYGLSKILGRPASASALRRWLQAARNRAAAGPARFVAANASLKIAGRNLLNNLPERLAGPMPHAQEDEHHQQAPIPRPDPRPYHHKTQDRAPAH